MWLFGGPFFSSQSDLFENFLIVQIDCWMKTGPPKKATSFMGM